MAMGAGSVRARPSEAPINGAVQGDATTTAKAPESAESAMRLRSCIVPRRPGSKLNSSRPARLSAIKVKSNAKAEIMRGDCK